MSPVTIGVEQLRLLKSIKAVFEKDKTNYEIVISPVYDQQRLNTKDLNQLQEIFGKEYVHDFSGKNSITDNVYNYYETSHYLPSVADTIMKIIYKAGSN